MNNRQFFIIPLIALAGNTAPLFFLDKGDILNIDLTDQFPAANIYSVEKYMNYKKNINRKNIKEKIVSYGFPKSNISNYINYQEYIKFEEPSLYEGQIGNLTNYDFFYKKYNIDSLYVTITPAPQEGRSGSPVFKQLIKRKKSWIEFLGVQSGKNENYKCGYVVKKDEVLKMLK